MYTYILHIDDFNMYRHPQSVVECHKVEAPTAADAITIGKIRHNFPLCWVPSNRRAHDHRMKTRTLINVTLLGQIVENTELCPLCGHYDRIAGPEGCQHDFHNVFK